MQAGAVNGPIVWEEVPPACRCERRRTCRWNDDVVLIVGSRGCLMHTPETWAAYQASLDELPAEYWCEELAEKPDRWKVQITYASGRMVETTETWEGVLEIRRAFFLRSMP